jgi:hypothetical protein
MKNPIKSVSRPLDTPAVLATQVNLAVTDHGWRLTFGEQVSEEEAVYHTGVFLPTATAHQLTQLMIETMHKQKDAHTL